MSAHGDVQAALHGAGRFAQHLLHAWLRTPSPLTLSHWCDEQLDAQAVCELLHTHDRLDFAAANPAVEGKGIALTHSDGRRCHLPYHHGPAYKAPCIGEAEIWLECSGRYALATKCQPFIQGRTERVLVSATCREADQTLVMGFNEAQWRADARVLSYGSCTVNAFVPLAHWIHSRWGVQEAEVQVIHNQPGHRLPAHPHPVRTECTLTYMGPALLSWLSPEHFAVNYTLIPYAGASLIDLRFRLQTVQTRSVVTYALREACDRGPLAGYYALQDEDPGVANVMGSPCNAVFHEAGLRLQGDTLRLAGYFDNENSAVRYLALAGHIAQRISVRSTRT